mmetsp:Transcript_63578/g.163649  ORF Transcript_63578/g.163649 Transcript_63578/m.163649 type:complete len:294 (+) Transcript_63578:748-1629(+)
MFLWRSEAITCASFRHSYNRTRWSPSISLTATHFTEGSFLPQCTFSVPLYTMPKPPCERLCTSVRSCSGTMNGFSVVSFITSRTVRPLAEFSYRSASVRCCRHLRTVSRSSGAERPRSELICAFDISRSCAQPVSRMPRSFSSTCSPTPMLWMMVVTSSLPHSIGQAMTLLVAFELVVLDSGVSARRTAPAVGEAVIEVMAVIKGGSPASVSRHLGGEARTAMWFGILPVDGVGAPTRGVGAPTRGVGAALAPNLALTDLSFSSHSSFFSEVCKLLFMRKLGGEGVGFVDSGA